MSASSVYLRNDTICALATPPGRSAIALIRISGPDSFSIGRRLCAWNKDFPITDRHVYFQHLIDPQSQEIVDEALVTFFKGPHSATGEDVVELSCHGSPVVIRRTLEICHQLGARAAEAGEFTFRAFRAGRIDLVEAEGIATLIESRTGRAQRCALRSLEGDLSKELTALREAIVGVAIEVETLIEFPDDVQDKEIGKDLLPRLGSLLCMLEQLRSRTVSRRVLSEGLYAPLLGRPNVGKSSLFNRLLGRERAIVTPHPGTTRDTVEGTIELAGLPITLVDTAGVRDTVDPIEQLGVGRSLEVLRKAHLVILVGELGNDPDRSETQLLQSLLEREEIPPVLLIANKADVAGAPPDLAVNPWLTAWKDMCARGGRNDLPKMESLTISALHENSAQPILDALSRLAASCMPDETSSPYALTDRQLGRLDQIGIHLHNAAQYPALPLEIVSDELREGLNCLSELDGSGVRPDLFGEIFSQFCIGK